MSAMLNAHRAWCLFLAIYATSIAAFPSQPWLKHDSALLDEWECDIGVTLSGFTDMAALDQPYVPTDSASGTHAHWVGYHDGHFNLEVVNHETKHELKQDFGLNDTDLSTFMNKWIIFPYSVPPGGQKARTSVLAVCDSGCPTTLSDSSPDANFDCHASRFPGLCCTQYHTKSERLNKVKGCSWSINRCILDVESTMERDATNATQWTVFRNDTSQLATSVSVTASCCKRKPSKCDGCNKLQCLGAPFVGCFNKASDCCEDVQSSGPLSHFIGCECANWQPKCED